MTSSLHDVSKVTIPVAGVWMILAGPAFWLGKADGLESLTYAAVLCLVPAWILFAVVLGNSKGTANPAVVMISAMGGRMLFAIFGAALISDFRPELKFWLTVWLVVFYLVTLAIETTLLVLHRRDEIAK